MARGGGLPGRDQFPKYPERLDLDVDLKCQSLKKKFDLLKQSINNCPKANQSKLQRLKEEKQEVLAAAEDLWNQIASGGEIPIDTLVVTGDTLAVALTGADVSQIVSDTMVQVWEKMQEKQAATTRLAIGDAYQERSADCREVIMELQNSVIGFIWQPGCTMRQNIAGFMVEHRHAVICDLRRNSTIHRMIFP
jgi:hypothetical protein